ncbi:MAG: hypothetical protein H0X28_12500 [Solirubrobacterales bacterium]|nr:hypothetical protein [Solirubrobacterales bacterium]
MSQLASLFPIGHIYDLVVSDNGRQHAFVCLAALLIAFLAIRTSARMTRAFTWWPGGVESGGVHLHHFVWGIFLMLGSGFLGIGLHLHEPWGGIDAAVFGAGAGLTLDEFALWTRLEDVYWSEEGRSSLEAVAIVGIVGLLVVIGVRPFDLDAPASAIAVSVAIGCSLLVSVIAFLKGRIVLGVLGLFILPLGLLGALRLAHPRSPWARRRYAPQSARRERAERRFEDPTRLGARASRRLADLIGGRPSEPEPPATETSAPPA